MDYRPFYISLGLFLFVGFVLNGLYSAFPFPLESTPFTNFVSNGLNINIPLPLIDDISFSLNPLTWFGNSVHNFFITQAQVFSILPKEILIPFFIIVFAGFLYTIIGWIRGV